MDVNTVVKIAGIGILVAVACQVLTRAGRDDQASLVNLAGIIVVLMLLVEKIGNLFASIKSIFGF
ncbi:MAG: stage III sporulation protein AC [Ruminococcaceae bacterium]|nr:stage III sporulation protein AC [Oscillospiraceae bacterium]